MDEVVFVVINVVTPTSLVNLFQYFRQDMGRKILGISIWERLSHDDLRSLSNSLDSVKRATNTKWSWGGHLARKDPKRSNRLTPSFPSFLPSPSRRFV